MTLEERYNRKRTPVVQRPELSTTPLVEPEVAGSQNPVAPTVDNTDETAPQASVVEPQMNDYQWNQRLYETLFQKPISQEEKKTGRFRSYWNRASRQCVVFLLQFGIRGRGTFAETTHRS